MTARRLGFIAEDASDIEVLKILTKKLTAKQFSVSYFTGKGCGPIRRKSAAWCKNFSVKGCEYAVIVHDLDKSDYLTLHGQLNQILHAAPQKVKAVVIPSEELEAWLLADEEAIASALKLGKIPKPIHHPETIDSPKEHLGQIVRSHSKKKKEYINTVHNSLIAIDMDVVKIRNKCPSFKSFEAFIGMSMK